MVEIRLESPGKNALGTKSMRALMDQLDAAGGEPVLLTGAGDAFSAGLNLKELRSLEGSAMEEFLTLLEDCMCKLYFYPGPTVAAVNGHAIAGGVVLTLCCDWRVCTTSPKARVGLTEVNLGVRFPPRLFEICRRRLPASSREIVLLGGALYKPEEALAVGIVDELAEDPVAQGQKKLSFLARSPGAAYGLLKQDLRGTAQDLCADEPFKQAISEMVPMWTSDGLRAQIDAMFKR